MRHVCRYLALAAAALAFVAGAGMLAAQAQPVPPDAWARTLLDGATLRAAGILTLADALRAVPGALVSEAGEFGGAAARVSLRGGGAHDVLVLVDGVPLNGPGGSVDLAHLSLDNVATIEVIRGPMSAAYGTYATSGVILVTSGSGASGLRAGGRSGTPGVAYGHGEVALRVGRGDVAIGASLLGSSGFVVSGDDYGRRSLAASASVALREGTVLAAGARWHSVAYRYANVAGRVDSDPRLDPFRDAADRTVLSARLAHQITSRVAVSLSLGAAAFEVGHDDTLAAWDLSGDSMRNARSDELRGSRAELVARAALPYGAELSIGAARDRTRRATVDEWWRLLSVTYARVESHAEQRTSSLFARILRAGSEAHRLGWDAAVRRVHDRNGGGDLTSWNLVTRYSIAKGTEVHAGFGVARALAGMFDGYPVDQRLKPERTTSANLGVAQRLAGGRMTVTATAVHVRTDDVALPMPLPGTTLTTYLVSNVGSTAGTGLEIQSTASPGLGLSLSLRGTYLPVRVSHVDPSGWPVSFWPDSALPDRPDVILGADIAWRPNRRLSMGASVVRVGSRAVVADALSGPPRGRALVQTRVDATASARLLRGMAVVARVDNVLDAVYDVAPGYPARRRTVLVGGEVAMQ